MQKDKLMNVLERLTLAAAALGVGLWGILASMLAALSSGKRLWRLGADGFPQGSNEVLLSGGAFEAVYFVSMSFMIVVPVLVLAIPIKYFSLTKWVLVRIVVFVAVQSLDFWVVMRLFGPYVPLDPVLAPMPHAFDEIRAGFGPVERVVYGGLLDQAERGASSWIVVIHAAVLTAVILVAFEVLRWLYRRLRSSKSETTSRDEIAGSQ